jgi:fibronectin-binding autotransporter adhesin
LSGAISGTNNLNFNGGTVILGGATTYSGTTTVIGRNAGNRELPCIAGQHAQSRGWQRDIQRDNIGHTGGIDGTANLNLVNTASVAVALSVGESNLNTTYAGAFTGSGSINMVGSGVLTLTGASNSTGGATVTGANLTIAGGDIRLRRQHHHSRQRGSGEFPSM